jgi:hypothetical protein
MLFTRSAFRHLAPKITIRDNHVRMVTTLVGDSSRVYAQGDLLSRNGENLTRGVFEAQQVITINLTPSMDCSDLTAKRLGTELLVLKRVDFERSFDTSAKVEAECAESRRLRIHIDHNTHEEAFIYPYYESTLLIFLREYPETHYLQRKKILRHVAEGIRELHSRSWAHLGQMRTFSTAGLLD